MRIIRTFWLICRVVRRVYKQFMVPCEFIDHKTGAWIEIKLERDFCEVFEW